MAQRLRALVALAEDLGLVPGTYIGAHKQPESISRESKALF